VQVLPGVFGGLQQSRDECRLELGDSGRLRFEFQDVGLDAARPRFAVVVLPCRVLHPGAPEHREQIAGRLRRGADRAGPCGYVASLGSCLRVSIFDCCQPSISVRRAPLRPTPTRSAL
jgi:hypothetical protein